MPKKFRVDNVGNLIWKQNAQVSPEFAKVLDQMVLYAFPQRYQSATEALQAIQNI